MSTENLRRKPTFRVRSAYRIKKPQKEYEKDTGLSAPSLEHLPSLHQTQCSEDAIHENKPNDNEDSKAISSYFDEIDLSDPSSTVFDSSRNTYKARRQVSGLIDKVRREKQRDFNNKSRLNRLLNSQRPQPSLYNYKQDPYTERILARSKRVLYTKGPQIEAQYLNFQNLQYISYMSHLSQTFKQKPKLISPIKSNTSLTFQDYIKSYKSSLSRTKMNTLRSYKNYLKKQNDLTSINAIKGDISRLITRCNNLTGLNEVYIYQKEDRKREKLVEDRTGAFEELLAQPQRRKDSSEYKEIQASQSLSKSLKIIQF